MRLLRRRWLASSATLSGCAARSIGLATRGMMAAGLKRVLDQSRPVRLRASTSMSPRIAPSRGEAAGAEFRLHGVALAHQVDDVGLYRALAEPDPAARQPTGEVEHGERL